MARLYPILLLLCVLGGVGYLAGGEEYQDYIDQNFYDPNS